MKTTKKKIDEKLGAQSLPNFGSSGVQLLTAEGIDVTRLTRGRRPRVLGVFVTREGDAR
jgi:hypothetical protein